MLCACAERQDRLEAKLSDFLQEDLKFMVAEVMVGGKPSALVDSPFYVIRDLRFFEGASAEIYSAYAEGRELRDLVAVVGEEALTERDQKFLEFAQAFEDRFITQSKDEDRTIFETLDLGWDLLKILPKTELKRVKEEFIEQYLPKE